MGIKDLTKIISDQTTARTDIKLSDLKTMTIAIDISIYMNKYIRAVGLEHWLTEFMFFLITLKRHKLKMICIFDGKNKPIDKVKTQQKRRDNFDKISDKMDTLGEIFIEMTETGVTDENRKKVKDLTFSRFTKDVNFDDDAELVTFLESKLGKLANQTSIISDKEQDLAREAVKVLGISAITADGEAETLCATLAVKGVVDAVLTEDTDILCYGTKIMLRNLDSKNNKIEVIQLDVILRDLNLSFESFVDLCILLGCDYNNRVKSYGVKKSYETILTHQKIENIGFSEEDIKTTNYIRCRKLFKPIKLSGKREPILNKNINMEDLKKYILTNKIKISLSFIEETFKPQLSFLQ